MSQEVYLQEMKSQVLVGEVGAYNGAQSESVILGFSALYEPWVLMDRYTLPQKPNIQKSTTRAIEIYTTVELSQIADPISGATKSLPVPDALKDAELVLRNFKDELLGVFPLWDMYKQNLHKRFLCNYYQLDPRKSYVQFTDNNANWQLNDKALFFRFFYD